MMADNRVSAPPPVGGEHEDLGPEHGGNPAGNNGVSGGPGMNESGGMQQHQHQMGKQAPSQSSSHGHGGDGVGGGVPPPHNVPYMYMPPHPSHMNAHYRGGAPPPYGGHGYGAGPHGPPPHGGAMYGAPHHRPGQPYYPPPHHHHYPPHPSMHHPYPMGPHAPPYPGMQHQQSVHQQQSQQHSPGSVSSTSKPGEDATSVCGGGTQQKHATSSPSAIVSEASTSDARRQDLTPGGDSSGSVSSPSKNDILPQDQQQEQGSEKHGPDSMSKNEFAPRSDSVDVSVSSPSSARPTVTDCEKGDNAGATAHSATASTPATTTSTISSPPSSVVSPNGGGEEDEVLQGTAPMRHDFHFYVDDNFEQAIAEAREQLGSLLSLNQDPDSGNIDSEGNKTEGNSINPLLLFTNVNERLMLKWEKAPQEERDGYRLKEDADRVRFMQEDEVASRHCATLTARTEKKSAAMAVTSASSPAASTVSSSSHATPSATPSVTSLGGTSAQMTQDSSGRHTQHDQEQEDTQKRSLAGGHDGHVDHTMPEMSSESMSQPHQGKVRPSSPSQSSEGSPTKKMKASPEGHSRSFLEDGENESHPSHPSEVTTEDFQEKAMQHGSENQTESTTGNVLGTQGEEGGETAESDVFEVEKLLDRRFRQVRGRKVREYLVRWKGHDAESDTWEPYSVVSHLENEVRSLDFEKDKALKSRSPK